MNGIRIIHMTHRMNSTSLSLFSVLTLPYCLVSDQAVFLLFCHIISEDNRTHVIPHFHAFKHLIVNMLNSNVHQNQALLAAVLIRMALTKFNLV